VRILSSLSPKIVVVGRSEVAPGIEWLPVKFPDAPGVLQYSLFQIRATIALWRGRRGWDAAWFLLGGTAMAAPIIASRIAGKKVVLVWTASSAKSAVHQHGPLSFHTLLLSVLESLAITFSTHVVTYGPSVSLHVRRLQSRVDILPYGAEFVEFDRYKPGEPVTARPISIGFVGRLSHEKGILNFLEALTILLLDVPDLDAYVVGAGPLGLRLREFAKRPELKGRLHATGYVGQERLPALYGRMRVLVIPSYTEGGPNVMLEAMACGTPVLATKVGTIPDVIKDHVNGFLLSDNTPESIAEGVRAVLSIPPEELELVSRRAESTVKQAFGFSECVERYRKIANRVLGQE
jgi:glycosyltransferase involved in cell wall biosynthesis